MRNFIVFVMVASRMLRAVAVFVILLYFAPRFRKLYWSGCMKATITIYPQIFSILSHYCFFWFHVRLDEYKIWDVKSAM